MNKSIAMYGLLFVLCAHAASAASGTAYTVRIVRSGDKEETRTFKVVTSGDRLRASLLDGPPGEGILYDVLLRTGGAGVIALNTRNRTWYELEHASPFAIHSTYLSPGYEGKARNVRVKLDPPRQEQGERHYAGEVAYDVELSFGPERVKVSCVATFRVSTTDAAGRGLWLGDILPRTRFPAVDAGLKAAEAGIEGFPVRLSLDAKRTYAGGAPMVDTIRVEVSELGEAAVDGAELVRPADYRNQEPILGVPGVSP